MALKVKKGREHILYHRDSEFSPQAHVYCAITSVAEEKVELVDRQVFFAIETVETAAEIPCEKMIAIKAEIMDNWDEYWRVCEELIEESDRQNAYPEPP